MNARSPLASPLIYSVAALEGAARREMYALYERYYDATSYGRFCGDLAGKDHAVLLRDETGALRGFSTLAVYERLFGAEPLRVLFSGDTIVDERYWGQQALAFAWLRLAGEIKAQRPDRRLYWFLISKGHRTYRYLSVFSREFYPAPDRETPRYERGLMAFLARDRFGTSYEEATGLVRFAHSQGHLRSSYADVPCAHRRLPEVTYFLERNPGYAGGDELVCLCELAAENLKPIARRAFLPPATRSVPR